MNLICARTILKVKGVVERNENAVAGILILLSSVLVYAILIYEGFHKEAYLIVAMGILFSGLFLAVAFIEAIMRGYKQCIKDAERTIHMEKSAADHDIV